MLRSFVRRARGLSLAVLVIGSFDDDLARAQPPTPSDGPTGGLTAEQIRGIVQANIGDVQDCYERALQRTPQLTGTVVVAYVIQADGSVRDASVASCTFGDRELEDCVVRAASRWIYPRPEPPGPVSVRFPFNLMRAQDSEGVCEERGTADVATWPRAPAPRAPSLYVLDTSASIESLRAVVTAGTDEVRRLRRDDPARPLALRRLTDASYRLEEALAQRLRALETWCAGNADPAACRASSALDTQQDELRALHVASNAALAMQIRDYPDATGIDATLFQLGEGLAAVSQDERADQVDLALAVQHPESPLVPYAYESIARRLYERGLHDDAHVVYERALLFVGDDLSLRAHLLVMLGNGLARRCQTVEALERFEQAQQISEAHPSWTTTLYRASEAPAMMEALVVGHAELLAVVGLPEPRDRARARWSRREASPAERRALAILDEAR